MRVLVTGSKGFIGSRLCNRLREFDCQLLEFDKGDSLPNEAVDIVFHLAANVNAYDSVKHPLQAQENIDLVFQILEWMRKTKSEKIVFASSREIYSLENPYGVSKFCGELIIKSYAQLYGIIPCIVRISNIYGKGNLSHRFIEKTVAQAQNNEDIIVYGGTEKVLNFVHVDTCVDTLVEYLYTSPPLAHIAAKDSWSLVDIAQFIISFLGSKSKIIMKENRKGETLQYYPPEFSCEDDLTAHLKELCLQS